MLYELWGLEGREKSVKIDKWVINRAISPAVLLEGRGRVLWRDIDTEPSEERSCHDSTI
jgi:hypothetical protein